MSGGRMVLRVDVAGGGRRRFPPETEQDWSALVRADAEGLLPSEQQEYLRHHDNLRRWYVALQAETNQIDLDLARIGRQQTDIEEEANFTGKITPEQRDQKARLREEKDLAKRLKALLGNRRTEANQAIRERDEQVRHGGVAVRAQEQLLAWAASLVPRDGDGAAWHEALRARWAQVLPSMPAPHDDAVARSGRLD